MDLKFNVLPPFFEIGPKAFLYGQKALNLALYADELSQKYQVQIIFTPQSVDLYQVAKACPHIYVFAQHMDALSVGRGVGSVLPEAVKSAGAVGVLLNHAEKPLKRNVLKRTIERADEVGLATLVCAGNINEVVAVAKMNPNIVLAEAAELIGTGKRSQADQDAIQKVNKAVQKVNPAIHVLHGAGIKNEKDVYNIISLGAEATGSTSGIIHAEDPYKMLDKMICAVRQAWNITHQHEEVKK